MVSAEPNSSLVLACVGNIWVAVAPELMVFALNASGLRARPNDFQQARSENSLDMHTVYGGDCACSSIRMEAAAAAAATYGTICCSVKIDTSYIFTRSRPLCTRDRASARARFCHYIFSVSCAFAHFDSVHGKSTGNQFFMWRAVGRTVPPSPPTETQNTHNTTKKLNYE